MAKKRLLVIGDTIIDESLYLKALGLSLETPTMKCEFISRQVHFGGAANVAKYANLFGLEVDFYTSMTEEMATSFMGGNNLNLINAPSKSDNLKVRHYITHGDNTYNYLQINHPNSSISKRAPENFLNLEEYSVIAISDYRLGFIDRNLIDFLKNSNKVIFAASQLSTNVSNYDQYLFARYIICNKHESEFVSRKENVYVTMGSDGCKFNGIHFPGFAVEAKKTIGAGDVFFAALLASDDPLFANKMAAEYVAGNL